jgi:exonuclease SbcC
MRLHTLTLEAFGPYAERQEIDFDALTATGLFLLEGPTGAGKSSILDAITFALYGGLAGRDADADRLHSHFAGPHATPQVSLELSVRGTRLRVTRSPQHERPKKRGDGVTTEKASAHLERLEGGAWVSQSSSISEVGSLLTEQLGLSREQFTQVVLLPQGEFATFLKAGDDARREVLTRLFGAGLYDRITNILLEARKQAGRDIEAATGRRDQALAAAREAAGLSNVDNEAPDAGPAGLGAFLAEVAADLAAAQQAAVRRVDEAARHCAESTTRATEAADAAERAERLRATLAERARHEAGRPEHEARRVELASAHAALAVRPLLEQVAEAERATAEANGELAQVIDEPTAEESHGEGASERRSAAAAAREQAAALRHLVAVEESLAAQREAVEQAALETQRAAATLDETQARAAALPDQITARRAQLAEAQQTAAGWAAASQQAAALRSQHDAAASARSRAPEVSRADEAHRRAVDAHQRAVDEHQRLQDARLDGMAAELAASLHPGGPCPVCGSTEHPMPATAAADAVSAGQVRAAQKSRDDAEAARTAAHEHLAALGRDQGRDEALAGGADVEQLRAALTEAEAAVGRAEAARDAIEGLTDAVTALDEEASTVAQRVVAATQVEAATAASLAQAQSRLAVDERTVGAAREGHPTVQARQSALLRQAERNEAAARALEALHRAVATFAERSAAATRGAALAGFADVAAAAAAVRDAAAMAALDLAISDWEAETTRLATLLADPELAGLDPTQVEALRQAADDAAIAARAAKEAEDAAREAQTTADRQVGRFAARRRDVEVAAAECEHLERESAAVFRLAPLVKGTSGHRRVALTTYVLRLWFEKVVQAANLRLADMSGGRYALERVDQADRANERVGLTLQVVDRHTGQSRSEKSLSGGETFYTSLALALGLADVVTEEAGGVSLDTLFIDEGFGSLDLETLDQVMGVIDDLRVGGRVVGIVSHVAELKDRVAERLEVSREAEGGPSRVRVIA